MEEKKLTERLTEYGKKYPTKELNLLRELEDMLEDGELVSKEWHDEQVGHAELVIKEQEAEIERLTREVDKQKNFVTAWEESWKIADEKNTKIRVKLKKENAELQKQVDELKKSQANKYALEAVYNNGYEQAVKDTAKEILDEAENLLHECAMEYANAGHKDYFGVCENISWKVIRKIAKEKGVEVE